MEYMKWTGQRNRRTEPQQVRFHAVDRENGERSNKQTRTAGKGVSERDYRQSRRKGALADLCVWIKKNRKVQLILLLCGVLLVGGVTKWITNRIFYQEADMVEAFLTTESGCVETRLQVTADYGSDFLTEHDKQALLGFLANALGIQMDGAVTATEDEVSQIYTYTKQARRAETTFKVVTLKENNSRTYLYTELVIYEDTEYDILEYRDRIVRALKELTVLRVETTLQFLGAYEGQMALSEWNRISNRMVEELGGEIVYENRDPDLYTVYAYTTGLPEYITSNGKQVNIQVAMRYEPDNNRTVVYLASPIIREDW